MTDNVIPLPLRPKWVVFDENTPKDRGPLLVVGNDPQLGKYTEYTVFQWIEREDRWHQGRTSPIVPVYYIPIWELCPHPPGM